MTGKLHNVPPRLGQRMAWKHNAENLRKFLRDFKEELGREPTNKEIQAAHIPGLGSPHAIQVARLDMWNFQEEQG